MPGNERIVQLVGDIAFAVPVVTNPRRESAVANISKIAGPLGVREDTHFLRACRVIEALGLPIKEEEQLVLDDRATDCAAEHVPAKLILRKRSARAVESVLPLVGVQHVIAEEFP